MAAETRVLIFTSQALALLAAQAITNNAGIGSQAGSSTMVWDTPQPLSADPAQRWFIRHPTDDTWLSGVGGYTVASGVGQAPINEGTLAPTLVPAGTWRDRFTDSEKAAVTIAAAHALAATPPDPSLSIMLDDLASHGVADLNSARVQAGMKALVAAGLVTSDRAAVIMAPVGLTA